ncbi:MAG: aminoglycoside phosphotransferase family protein [Trueperaceae bacterium]|nr:aminoglycoside phosphotransferase family protein [Trueperaceae bacterium]
MSEFDALAFLSSKRLIQASNGVRLEPLKGGYWNEVYRIQGDGFDWVLKRFYQEALRARLYPMLPDSEALALKTLKGKALAPEFVAYFPAQEHERAVLIYHYVPGSLYSGNIANIATLMRQLHKLDVADAPFRVLPQTPEEILKQADELLAASQDDELGRNLKALRPEAIAMPLVEKPSLVHTDAWIGNFIGENNQLRLIDWQCPGLGDPAEDIWTFLESGFQQLINLPLYSTTEKVSFLETYADETLKKRLELLRPYFAYRVAAHCVMRIQDFKDRPQDKKAYETVLETVLEQLT